MPSFGVKARIGIPLRRRVMRRTESPDSVKTQRNFASTNSATSAAASVMAPPCVKGRVPSLGMRSSPCSSVDSMMRAMVLTVTTGNSPTLVSPLSMSASAPSSTALAQSEASARVGRGLVIMDSSICVATMTGLALRRASSTARFCTMGTASSGSSTPRSPRATMIASNASTISSSASTACGFSTLATTGTRRPSSSMISCTRTMSEASRTKLSAMRSAPRRRPQRRSASSLPESAGTLTATPGRLMPLMLLTAPPTSTVVVTRVPSVETTRSVTLPSSMSNGSPGFTSPGRPLYVVEQMSFVPRMSSTVMTKVSPKARSCGPSENLPSRIFGPCRSTRTATARPASSAAFRIVE